MAPGPSGWPITSATGPGNLQAQTATGDSIGYNFNDQGTGGFTAITRGAVLFRGNGIVLYDTGGGVVISVTSPMPSCWTLIIYQSAVHCNQRSPYRRTSLNNSGVMTIRTG